LTATPNKSPFSDEELKKIAKKKILMKFALKIHVLAYVGVNIALFAINYLTSGLSAPWFVYPLAGWFMGIVAHGVVYAVYARGVSSGAKIGLILDAAIYAASVPALLAINYFSDFGYMWFLWPAIFWLLGVVAHAIAIKMATAKKVQKEPKKSWLERGVEKEMEKAKKARGGN
jgi:hypothetical protein